MATTTLRFADIVRAKLQENKTAGVKPDSIRSLAKAMGGGSEDRAATYRRSLFKWMAEGEPNPSPESRVLVAEALGLEDGALDEDEEEADPVASFLDGLMKRVDERLDQLFAKTSNAPGAHFAASTPGASTNGG